MEYVITHNIYKQLNIKLLVLYLKQEMKSTSHVTEMCLFLFNDQISAD